MPVVREMYKFRSAYPYPTTVDNGVKQLWMLPPNVQEDILSQAMDRFDTYRLVSLASLGFPRLKAVDLVRRKYEYCGSRLSDRDIITCLLMGNLDIYPLRAIDVSFLGRDSLDCGIWDDEIKAGYFFYQRSGNNKIAINPGNSEDVAEMWEGPIPIPRMGELKKLYPKIDSQGIKDKDGCLILRPSEAYLFGIWPAIRLEGLNVSLETRSNMGRWTFNAAVNSVTAHDGFTGVLTAEATTFAGRKRVFLSTGWLPFQMVFDYVNSALEREVRTTFSESPHLTAEEAAQEFQNNPRRMLPRPAQPQRELRSNNQT